MTEQFLLKPCPICDDPMKFVMGGDYFRHVDGSDCILGDFGWARDKVAAWNQRAKPVVKALEFFKWKRAGGGYHEGQFAANTQAGNYAIMHQASKGAYYLACPDSTGYYDTLDEAKAAAQADFTRRVLNCLEGHDD